jgi:TPR repeat protein
MPAVEDVRRPRLNFRFLVAIDETAFRSSAPADQARLAKAATAFRAMRYADVLDSLVGSAPTDPNVVYMRGLAAIYQDDSDHFRRAVEQLRAAAAAGHVQAGTMAGALLVSGVQGVPKDLAEGKRLIEAAAARGDPMAQRATGIGYLGGEFGVLDPFKGASFIKSAADAGDPAAMLHHAYLMSTGAVVEKNEKAAEELVLRIADAGLTAAQETLGMWILERYKAGLISDPSEGIRWLERAYQRGLSIMALSRLGLFYLDEGRNPPWKDAQKAFALFGMCVPFTHMNCHYAYATSLHFGRGTAKDLGKAYVHYEIARQLGSTGAPARLKRLDELLAPAEKDAALEAARAQRGELKPSPRNVVLQYADIPEPASPWTVAPSLEGARAMPAQPR